MRTEHIDNELQRVNFALTFLSLKKPESMTTTEQRKAISILKKRKVSLLDKLKEANWLNQASPEKSINTIINNI